jgi:DNA mismatch repair protein MutS2
MNQHSLQILEYSLVQKALSQRAATPYGKEEAQNLRPFANRDFINNLQEQTAEARKFLESGFSLDFWELQDIRKSLDGLAAEGAVMEPLSLLSLSRHLYVARQIRSTLGLRREEYPVLSELAQGLTALKELEQRIAQAIEPDGRVADRASTELYHIRREQETARQRIHSKLEDILGAESAGIQENIITMREGRYVIPVKADSKSRIKGIVHDSSASGATVYMEPLATIELNNRMRQLIVREKEEVERILRDLSLQVSQNLEVVQRNIELIARFDLIYARSQLALAWSCCRPVVSSSRYIRLIKARHPALKDPVPLDLELGDGKLTMVITGPNTGGKTVVLKTVGLLSLMHQSGLQVPAAEGSALPVFFDIFADIGDEQSIAQSLSTFSSHIGQIKSIVEAAGTESLVLLDEIGAGTEPSEGAALAMSVLLHLTQNKCLTLSTTHYGALKAFVQANEEMLNAAMEFDRERLAPSYRLMMGIPGASYGIEIASRLGLPPDIVADARGRIDTRSVQLEELISFLESTKRRMEQRELEAANKEAEAESLKTEYEEKVKGLKEELKQLKQSAAEEARNILSQARSAAEQAVAEIKKQQADKQSIARSRELLQQAEQALPHPVAESPDNENQYTDHTYRPGDRVRLSGMQKEGEVLEVLDAGKKLKIQVGGVKMTVPRQKARPIINKENEQKKEASLTVSEDQEKLFPPELHLLGMRAEESIEALDKYLGEAVYHGIGSVRIVHGKGTGVLRKVVKERLGQDPRVKSFRLGQWNEGQDGVTVVELK